MRTRVFVYGTLKRGCRNHHWMNGADFVCEAVTRPEFRMFDAGGFPALVRDGHGHAIEGELWSVPPDVLARLDVLEGIAEREYERVETRLSAPDESALVYLWLRSADGMSDVGACWRE